MSILQPKKTLQDKVLFYVTDVTSYKIKFGHALKEFYPKLIHVSCMDYGLHKVAEANLDKFHYVDDLIISNTRKVFLKFRLD